MPAPASAQQLNRADAGVVQEAQTAVHGPDRIGKDGPMAQVGLELALLYYEHRQFEASGTANVFRSEAVVSAAVDREYVTVDIVARKGTESLEADLRRLGAERIASFRSLVSARVPIDEIRRMAGLSSMHSARIARAARSGASIERSEFRSPLAGSVQSEGDAAMNTDDVRAAFGIDGNGTRIGVLSDSYDTSPNASTTAADDIASGDLPPADRILVQDDGIVGSDEGRGMMQLIYDVAPGADLAFHTAFDGQANFAEGILALADAGADVIVDDIFYFAEPFYQDGVIAQAVDEVAANGVPYFSSAGNSARQSYASSSFTTVTAEDGDEVYDFDPGAAVDTLQQVTVPVGASVTISFQWDDPFRSVTGDPARAADTDLDIVLVDRNGDVVAGSTSLNIGGDPVEVFGFFNDGSTDTDGDSNGDETFNLKIVKADGEPDPGRVKYTWSGTLTVEEFGTQSPTSVGHSVASGGAGVAAAYYQQTPAFGTSPPVPEGFTSVGGTPILFNADGTRKAAPEFRNQPRITAPDGTNTTFFGNDRDGDGLPNFSGTSAAAPHAAALAALQLQADPSLTPSDVYAAQEGGAVDMEASGFDYRTGYGLVDAEATIASVTAEPNIEFAPVAVDAGERFLNESTGDLYRPFSARIRVANVGTAPLEITRSGLNGTGFRVVAGEIPTGSLAEDAEETVTVAFDPGETGSFSARFDVESNDPDTPTASTSLAGEARLPPVAEVSVDRLFEAVETGEAATQTIQISNTGDTPLDVDVFAEALGLGPFDPSEVAVPSTGASGATRTGPRTLGSLRTPAIAPKQGRDAASFLYTIDDGVPDTDLGFMSGADVLWLNAFRAQDGATNITALSAAFGAALPVGSDVEFLLYEDPDDDGNPDDATLEASVETTTEVAGGGTQQIEPISPTPVTGVFFVAVLVPNTSDFVAPLDESSDRGASWLVGTNPGTIDTQNLQNNPPSPITDDGFSGNWVLRAQGAYVTFEPVSGELAAGASTPVDITFDGSSLATGRYTANAAVTSNDPATPRIDLPVTFFVADAVAEAELASSGSNEIDVVFGNTGFEANLTGASGSGTVTAMRFDDAPANVSGLAAGESPSSYRWFIRQDGDLTFDASSELRFLRSGIPQPGFDASNAGAITVYRRSDFGSGTFNALTTSFDDGTTAGDLSDDALTATGATSFSEFVFASDTAPLPVEVASFDAVRDGPSVVLSWTTTSETNNAGFQVERRPTNAETWTDTGVFVEGNGTTSEQQTYRVRLDNLEPNTYTFRLRSVDVDATENVGPTAEVEVPLNEAYKVSPVRPNPITSRGRIDVQVREQQQVTATLYNILGQQVRTVHDGPLTANTRHTMTVNASSLASGIYFLRVDGESFQTTRKITLAQ